MTDVEQMRCVALVMAQTAAAYARIEGMKAANLEREHKGFALAYSEEFFEDVIEAFGLGQYSVITKLNGGE